MRSPLHIGYLVQQFPPEVGAGPARVLEMALRWKSLGCEVTVVTGMPNRPGGRIYPEYRGRAFLDEEWDGIRVLRSWLYASPKHGLARTLLNNVSFAATSAIHALRRVGAVDVMIASSPPFFVHLPGLAFHAARRVPLVLEVRDLWPDYLVGMGVVPKWAVRGLFALEHYLLRRAQRVVAVTESFRKRIEEKGIPGDRIDVVPNGVDTGRYYPSAEAAPIPELERRQGEFIVGYLGNFGSGQGLRSVVEAAARLRETDPEIRMVLVGDGPDGERVRAHARALGATNLEILPPIPKDRTRAFYAACDVCLVPLAPFPILQETIPSKIFEILACERPVLASLGGEAARILEESGGGLVVPPGDPEALARGLRRLRAMSPEQRRAMGRRGRAFVADRFDRTGLADRYLEIVERAARSAHGRAIHSSARP